MNKKDILSGMANFTLPKIILAIALFATVAGALFSTETLAVINKNIATAKESVRPANVKIIKITSAGCPDCFDVNSAVFGFKNLNVKVEKEEVLAFDSPEAKASIKKFAIKKIPTFLVTGEVTKNNLENFIKSNGEIKDKTFIFTKVIPIFIDTRTGREMGRVTVTLITDSLCSQCPDMNPIVENFKKAGVRIKDFHEYEWDSIDGRNVINQYKITKIPTFILSPEFDLYDAAKSNWVNFGTVEPNKTYVARNIPLPYRDLDKGQIVGLVDLIYLTDSSCTDCYNVQEIQKPILTRRYGVAIHSEQTIDIATVDGKDLISQYGITNVPTILLSPEADKYPSLKNIWQSVGVVESDGWFVFTKLNLLQNITYKDLSNNQIIKPNSPSASPTK